MRALSCRFAGLRISLQACTRTSIVLIPEAEVSNVAWGEGGLMHTVHRRLSRGPCTSHPHSRMSILATCRLWVQTSAEALPVPSAKMPLFGRYSFETLPCMSLPNRICGSTSCPGLWHPPSIWCSAYAQM